jgi:carbohydrate-binding protein
MKDDYSDTMLDNEAAVKAAEFYTSFRTAQIGALPSDLGEGW